MESIPRALAGYFVLLLVVRVLKRRAGSQMTLFEFVLVFLMGGVIILATVGNDRSVTNCTCAVVAVALIHRTVAWAKSKSTLVGAVVDGTPLLLIKQGEWQEAVLRKMRIRKEDLAAAARAHGISCVDEIDYAILERNGGISIIKTKAGATDSPAS
ncbi:DUF421 domain-containing protein [Sphingomonas sp. PL-96]|uniref:DUF421 domain-containing protein n=1 Tax=Sphingomonas sp. PL-96 TaxID=2887201 RepID=UPI001E543ADC|nr:YetF domain-containing protein [Sphingomonas sp. PL-96]MCC2978020.1 DUF421 domain-containing protein [Sphingomonas sp. PL-96]